MTEQTPETQETPAPRKKGRPVRVKNQLSVALDLLFEARVQAVGRDYSIALWYSEMGLNSTEVSRLRWVPDGTPATRQPASVMLKLVWYLADTVGVNIPPWDLFEMARTSWMELPTRGLRTIRMHLFPSAQAAQAEQQP